MRPVTSRIAQGFGHSRALAKGAWMEALIALAADGTAGQAPDPREPGSLDKLPAAALHQVQLRHRKQKYLPIRTSGCRSRAQLCSLAALCDSTECRLMFSASARCVDHFLTPFA